MNPQEIAEIRQIIREEVRAVFLSLQESREVGFDADHAARMILEGRGKEFRAGQKRLMQAERRKAA